jgi:Protein of unknown function (DUF3768)
MGQIKINTWDLIGAYPVCGACGSSKIRRDAWAEWNLATREWELQNIFDDFCCDTCGESSTPKWEIDAEFRTKRIRRLNDAMRHGQVEHGSIVITAGLQARDEAYLSRAAQTVAEFSDFSEGNDPHGEHDFGAFDLDGEKLFWKVDYFDRSLKWGSPDPANPVVTHRVLTIMLASEY